MLAPYESACIDRSYSAGKLLGSCGGMGTERDIHGDGTRVRATWGNVIPDCRVRISAFIVVAVQKMNTIFQNKLTVMEGFVIA
jgi:hypothetical protein